MGGGSAGETQARNGIEDPDNVLPGYYSSASGEQTLEGMDLEEDEGIGGLEHGPMTIYDNPSWSFDNLRMDNMGGLSQVIVAPPDSDLTGEGELFEGDAASDKAAGGSSVDGEIEEHNRILADFGEDQGTISGFAGTPQSRMGTPVDDIPPPLLSGDDDDDDNMPVAEVHLEGDNSGGIKMD